MAITITTQPQNVQVMEGKITQKLSVVATGATGYQWKKAKSGTSASGATNVVGQTTAQMTIPTDITKGFYYYFCAVTDGTDTVNTDIVTVEVTDFPEYITGEFVWDYVDACDASVKTRLQTLCSRRGITIPDTAVALRTEQIEIFMESI